MLHLIIREKEVYLQGLTLRFISRNRYLKLMLDYGNTLKDGPPFVAVHSVFLRMVPTSNTKEFLRIL